MMNNNIEQQQVNGELEMKNPTFKEEFEKYVEFVEFPQELYMNETMFEELWLMRPVEPNVMIMWGKQISAPRRYKVFGKPYIFTGMSNVVVDEVPDMLQKYVNYVNEISEKDYNSILINWYVENDYIGFHSDDERGMVKESDIYSVSFGGTRVMRFKEKKSGECVDVHLKNNEMIKMKKGCQQKCKHSILKKKTQINPRINITFRCMK